MVEPGEVWFAVVSDGVLELGRDVVDDGGEEISGLEDLEIPLGGVVELGWVDDGLGWRRSKWFFWWEKAWRCGSLWQPSHVENVRPVNFVYGWTPSAFGWHFSQVTF